MLHVGGTSEDFFALSGLLLAETTFISANGFLNLFLHLDIKSFVREYRNVDIPVWPLMSMFWTFRGLPSLMYMRSPMPVLRPVSKFTKNNLQFLAHHGTGLLGIEPFLQLHLLCIRDSACEGKSCVLKTRK
jgi:hypothetical protein